MCVCVCKARAVRLVGTMKQPPGHWRGKRRTETSTFSTPILNIYYIILHYIIYYIISLWIIYDQQCWHGETTQYSTASWIHQEYDSTRHYQNYHRTCRWLCWRFCYKVSIERYGCWMWNKSECSKLHSDTKSTTITQKKNPRDKIHYNK